MKVTTQPKQPPVFSSRRFLSISILLLLFFALALTWSAGQSVQAVLLQAGPACQLPPLQKAGTLLGSSSEVVAADFNHDGKPDVLLASSQQTFFGDGLGGFSPVAGNGYNWQRSDEILVGDVNGDGFPDLYVRRNDGGNNRQVQVFVNDKQGRFTLGPQIATRVFSFVVGDVNNDSLDDIVANTSGNNAVYLANANGTFTRLPNEFGSGQGASLLDVNGDGKLDFVNLVGRTMFIWQGSGNGTFSQIDFLSLTNVFTLFPQQKVADFNRDGRSDLLLLAQCDASLTMRLFLLLNNGRGNFTVSTYALPKPSSCEVRINGIGDFTGDGFPDIALSDGRIALNDGQGQICAFSEACCAPFALNLANINAVADFNGDGRADVINQEAAATMALWSAKAATQNTPPRITPNFPQTFLQGYQDRFFTRFYYLADVSDAEPLVRDLKVTLGDIPSGVTIYDVRAEGGKVLARFDVACDAVPGDYPLAITITDGGGLSAKDTWLMRIREKQPPRFTAVPSALTVGAGASLVFAAPAAVDASDVNIALTPGIITSPTFQGQIEVAGDGFWRIVNAAPAGTHTLTFTVTDRCGLQAIRTVPLVVTGNNTPPRVTPAAFTTIPQGSSAVEITLATLSDNETPAGNLLIDVTPLPGLTLNNIRNDNGVVKATPSIGCITPAVVYQINVKATDAGGLSATGTFNLTAGQNTPPELGTYPATTSLPRNGSATLAPASPPRDNGTTNATVSAPTFTGNVTVNAQGEVAISQATPVGSHSFIVTITDNCGATTKREFTVVVTEPSTGGCDVPVFGEAVSLDANVRPYGLASGDFNADGKPDLATTNYFDHTVTVLLATANGWAKQPAIPVGVLPIYVAARDLNGDGKLDLAVVNRGSDAVTILLGQGDGTFTRKGDYEVGNKSTGVAIGDFNGDGKLDLILPNDGLGNAAILDGNGDGSFGTLRYFFAGNSPQPPVVADFNQDGKPDVAFPQYFSGEVAIFLGQGNGSFQSPIFLSNLGGSGVEAIAVGDVNGDGKVDLAVTNTTTNQVFTLLGDGQGNFASGGGFATGSDYPASIVIADFTGDGKVDIAVGGYSDERISIFKNTGNGFDNNTPLRRAVGSRPLSLVTADFNGDGKPDLAIANLLSGTLSVLLNGCTR